MAKLIIDKSNMKKRGLATLHANNKNVVMNSASMWYGPAKSGKTRILAEAFRNTNYIFLDFDRNYDDVSESIEAYGGIYLNGKSAGDVLKQLLDGNITDTVVIVDALSDVKKYLLKYKMSAMNVETSRYKQCETSLIGIGINQEDTTTWFRETIDVMTNNSNSINFIHHTTENGRSKVEGNAGAWSAKFDITYKMIVDSKANYFELTHQRSNIAQKFVGNVKSLDDAVKYITSLISDKFGEDFDELTGKDIKSISPLRSNKLQTWVRDMKDDAMNIIFTISKRGRTTVYERIDIALAIGS